VTRLGSVLVIRLSSMGDVLFAVPAVTRLVQSGVAERVSWLVEDRSAALLGHVDGLHEVVVFPRRSPTRWPRHIASLLSRRDDALIDFQGNMKSRVQRAFLRSPRKIGFDAPMAKEGAQRGLTETVPPPARARHRIESNLALVTALGVPAMDGCPRPRLPTSPGARERTMQRLTTAGGGPAVLLHPGTSAFGEIKRWAPARFAELADSLHEQHGARIFISAGPGEEALAASVREAMSGTARVIPPGSFDDLIALLDAMDLVVAADSFPLHLANALGTPVVGLYGPKDPAVTGPYFDRSRVVRAGVACSPCTLRRCRDRICMDGLEVDAVRAAADELLPT
jgi:ADP-heptose:LPS heptosyltransferase